MDLNGRVALEDGLRGRTRMSKGLACVVTGLARVYRSRLRYRLYHKTSLRRQVCRIRLRRGPKSGLGSGDPVAMADFKSRIVSTHRELHVRLRHA